MPCWCRKYTACESFSPKIATSTFAPVTSFLPEDCTCRIARWITRWKPCVGCVSESAWADSRGVCSLMKSERTPRNSSRSTPHAFSTSAAEGLSSMASNRCSTVMNSCCFCRASTKAMWRETSSSCAIMLTCLVCLAFARHRHSVAFLNRRGQLRARRSSLLHRALERMLVSPRDVDHLVDLRRRNLARVRSAHAHSLPMHLQHDLCSLFPAHCKNSLQHHDDKVHRSVVVVEQQHLIQRRRLEPGFLGLEDAAVLLLVRHLSLRKKRGSIALCLMIATHFSRGSRFAGRRLDVGRTKRVQNALFGS